jgi:hypothetical protein
MLNLSLVKETRVVRCVNSTAAGITVIDGSSVDCAGYQGVLFVAQIGALTATQVTELKAQHSLDNGVDDAFADLAGSHVGPMLDTQSDLMLLLDVYRPQKRYVRPVVVRGTADAAIDSVIAILYGPEHEQPPVDATVADELYLVSPAAGTA